MEIALSYKFKNHALFTQAMTHSTFSRDKNYERLEFLGDAVLELIVTKLLYEAYPSENEGDLTVRRSNIVCEKSFSAMSVSLGLYKQIILSQQGMDEQLYANDSVLADVFEAYIGAIYLDSSFEETFHIVKDLFDNQIMAPMVNNDYKGTLAKEIQRRYKSLPVYQCLRSSGPEHRKSFTMGVYVDGRQLAIATAMSKKEAEREAARQALDFFLDRVNPDGQKVSVPQELLDAEERCPDVKFVQSCRKFFNSKGFLSESQRRALTFSGTPNRRARQFGFDNYEDGKEFDEQLSMSSFDSEDIPF